MKGLQVHSRTAFLVMILWIGSLHSALAQRCDVILSGIVFGIYDPRASSPRDTAGNIRVSCQGTGNVRYTISMNRGVYGTLPSRQMASGSFRLNYNLYRDAARSTVWGDGSAGTVTRFDSYQLPAAGTVSRDYPIYARAFALQSVGIGVYQDVITVTVDY